MAARTSTNVIGIALAVVIVVAVVVGIWRSVAGREPGQPADVPPNPPAVSTTPPYEHHEDDGETSQSPTAPAPTNLPSTGGHPHDEENNSLSAAERAVVLQRTVAFWSAFSLRDPAERDAALADVTVPYLAERMSVDSTSRIPVIVPVRSVIVDGTFSQATVVTQTSGDGASGNANNEWWYVTLIFDPVPETWSAQAYEEASPGLIAAAEKALKTEGR